MAARGNGHFFLHIFAKLFVAFSWVVTSTGQGGFKICVYYLMMEHPKAQPKVVFMEKPGIEHGSSNKFNDLSSVE